METNEASVNLEDIMSNPRISIHHDVPEERMEIEYERPAVLHQLQNVYQNAID